MSAIMGRKCDLTTPEICKGKSILQRSKMIGRYHKIVKEIVAALMKVCKRVDKCHLRVVSQCFLSQIKYEVVNNPG